MIRRGHQPTRTTIAMARRQVVSRMPARVRIERAAGEPELVPGSLRARVGRELVYEGRARVSLTMSSQATEGDQVTHTMTGQVVMPYSVDDRILRPRVEDVITVLEAPDQAQEGLVLRCTSIAAGGHLPIFRTLNVAGAALSRSWAPAAEMEPRGVREQG